MFHLATKNRPFHAASNLAKLCAPIALMLAATASHGQETIKIGGIFALSGPASFLGVPEEPFVDQFHSVMNEAARSGRSFAWINRPSAADSLKSRRPRWIDGLFTWASVCAVILFGWFAYSVVVKPLADSWQGRVEAGSVEIAPPTAFDKAR